MPTAIAARLFTPASSFALRAAAWGLGLFGLLRLPWIELHGVLPLTRLQGRAAVMLTGAPALPIDVTLACSGTDVLAMCAGAVLAYPARWRMRLAGAAGGVVLILALNTLRIGTLGRASGSPAVFDVLHLYVWPAALALAAAGYVFGWMRRADSVTPPATSPEHGSRRMARPARRFLVLAAALIIAFAAASPLYLDSAWVLAVAGFIARAAAAALRFAGVGALASGNLLITGRGGFAVTQECISTPLIPVYLAAVLVYAPGWRWRGPALLAAAPIFVALGIARLLVVALPAGLVESPLFFIHAFYQLLTAAVVVCIAALWRHGPGAGWRRAGLAAGAGAIGLYLLALMTARLFAAGPAFDDPQGALMLLPAFQLALFAALWIALCAPGRWRPGALCFLVLAVSQAALFAALHATDGFAALGAHVPVVRAWSLAAPIMLVFLATCAGRRTSNSPCVHFVSSSYWAPVCSRLFLPSLRRRSSRPHQKRRARGLSGNRLPSNPRHPPSSSTAS